MVRKSEKLLDSEKDMVYLYSEQKKNVYQNNSGSPRKRENRNENALTICWSDNKERRLGF